MTSCASIDWPSEFYLRGQWEGGWHQHVTPTTSPDAGDDGYFARFETTCPSWNKEIVLEDTEGELVMGNEINKSFRWGREVILHDCGGENKYFFDESGLDVLINGVSIDTTFRVYAVGYDGDELYESWLGFSTKDEFYNSKVVFRNKQGEVVVRATKSAWDDVAVGFGSDTTWDIEMLLPDDPLGDPVLISFVVAQLESEARGGDTCTRMVTAAIVVPSVLALACMCAAIRVYCCGEEK